MGIKISITNVRTDLFYGRERGSSSIHLSDNLHLQVQKKMILAAGNNPLNRTLFSL